MCRVAVLLFAAAILGGCGPAAPSANTPPANSSPPSAPVEAPPTAADFAESGDQTQLEPKKVGDFEVRALYTGELALGHFNFYITGGTPKAVRAWVGDEAATGALVTKANWEYDHYCAHMELPSPIPAEAALWFELEAENGQLHKASMYLH